VTDNVEKRSRLKQEQSVPPPPYKDGEHTAPAFSDEALALKYAEANKDGLRYVARFGQWFMWDGTRWKAVPIRSLALVVRGDACDLGYHVVRIVRTHLARFQIHGAAGSVEQPQIRIEIVNRSREARIVACKPLYGRDGRSACDAFSFFVGGIA
jgi:hypothetical protein